MTITRRRKKPINTSILARSKACGDDDELESEISPWQSIN